MLSISKRTKRSIVAQNRQTTEKKNPPIFKSNYYYNAKEKNNNIQWRLFLLDNLSLLQHPRPRPTSNLINSIELNACAISKSL